MPTRQPDRLQWRREVLAAMAAASARNPLLSTTTLRTSLRSSLNRA